MGQTISKMASSIWSGVKSVASACWTGIKKVTTFVHKYIIRPVVEGFWWVIKKTYQIFSNAFLNKTGKLII
jgi:hypothetical protein